jgi:drug/metabolite transporter (DMT)-like permease
VGLGGVVRVALLALFWGSNFLWIKVAVEGLSPVQLTLVRLALGAAVLVAIVGARRLRLPRGRATWRHLTVAALFGNALPYWLFAVGEQTVSSSLAGALNATTPLWTLALALVLRTERQLSATRIAGILLGFAGALTILAPWDAGATGSVLGAAACLAAAASYGLVFVYMERRLIGRGLPPLVLSAGQLTASTGLLLLATPVAGLQPPRLTPTVVWAAVLLGVVGTGGAYLLNYWIIADEGATAASTVTYLLPVVSVGLGAAVLGEPVTAELVVGTAVVLAGVALARRRREALSPPSGRSG